MKTQQNANKRIQEIATDKVEVFIDRKRDKKGHKLLTESIEKYGLLIPITVVALPEGKYKLVKGQGRLLAHQKLGLPRIKAFVFNEQELPDDEIIEGWLIENEVRDELSTVDKARLMKMEFEKNKSYEETASLFLTRASTVREYIGMLDKTSEKVIRMVEDNRMSFTQAKELSMTVKSKEAQESVAGLVVRNKLSKSAARIVTKRAKQMEQRKQKVTVRLLEKNVRARQADIRDNKRLLSALKQRYNRLVPPVKALMKDPEFIVLLKKHDLPTPQLQEEVPYGHTY